MKIENWYSENFENRLKGRYVHSDMISPILETYKNTIEITFPSTSEEGRKIPLLKLGRGSKKILMWSQMHGNESTTTKAIFDLIKFLNQKESFQNEISEFLSKSVLYIIPILNPDGALRYTRENANGVDLNRDAQDLSQKESQLLRALFEEIKPDLCLNMHDQRTIFGLSTGKSATISFLSPAADSKRKITPTRKEAMKLIVKMNSFLQTLIPGQVGRYDDGFNPNCVGDTFQMMDVPTILFEAGHFPNDYHREKTREFIFYSLLVLFDLIETTDSSETQLDDYFQIPENQKNRRDVIVRNIRLDSGENMDLSVQFVEKLENNKIVFEPRIEAFGDLSDIQGNREIDLKNNEIREKLNEKLSIGDKIHKIHKKHSDFVITFDEIVF